MLLIKYSKAGAMRYISHIDLLRHMTRILRRAEIRPEFSKGFNPHMLLYFSPPLALGLESEAEYLTVVTNESYSDAVERFNMAAPNGLRAIKAAEVAKNPNLQAAVAAADYFYPYPASVFSNPFEFSVTVGKKNDGAMDVLGERLIAVKEMDGGCVATLKAGAGMIRPDAILSALSEKYGESDKIVRKTAQYIEINGELKSVDLVYFNE